MDENDLKAGFLQSSRTEGMATIYNYLRQS